MSWLFLIFLTLMPFSPIFFKRLDLWLAAGQYFQVGLAILLAYSFFDKQKAVKIKNLPLALLTLYLGLHTAWYWHYGLTRGQFTFVILMPFFNFLCFLLFYRFSFQLNRRHIERILTFFSYSICVYLFLCVLQYFEHFPYFETFTMKHSGFDKGAFQRTVGFLGNCSQNAVYLGMCLPIFYLKKNRFSILCALLLWIIIGVTGSASGIVIAILVTIFFSFFYRLPKIYYILLTLCGLGVLLKHPDWSTYLKPEGRLGFWEKIYPLVKETSIFGRGLGTVNLLAQQPKFLGWRHVHNEFYHTWLTAGIVGMVSVLYCIWEYFRTMLKDRTSVVLASMFLGFCLASLIFYPAHLWIPCTIGMMGYSFAYSLKN